MTATAIFNDHLDLLNIGSFTHVAIDAHINDGSIHFTEGSITHGNLLGLTADDHINYFFALGRAGGQSMIGGTNPADGITLQSNTTNTGAGRINMLTPVEFGPYTSSTAVYAFNYAATEVITAGFVGGGLNMSGTISFSNSTMIYESFRGSPQITSNVNPGFAAYTVLQALPSLIAGPGAGNRPLNPLIINAAPRVNNPFSGARTSPVMAGMSNSPQINPSVSGAVMNVTNVTGYQFSPIWNTVAGSTANFGTMRGMWAKNPGQVIFGSSAGTEIGAAYYGFDVDNITINNGFGTMPVAAFRSAVQPSASKFMILNTGGAESDFGFGDIHLNDDTWLKLGNTVLNPDMIIGWQASQASLVFSTFFGAGGNPLYLRATASDEWIWQHNNGGTADIGMGFNVNAVSFGVVVPTPNAMNWFVRFEGPNNRQVHSAGVYSDVWWTAGGTIDVNGLAATEINSFRIDANVTALNGGTVQDQTGLFIAGMGFPGSGAATRIQSLRINGRSRMDGLMNYNEASLAQLTANTIALTLPVTNSGRFMILQDADALGPWAIQGIVNDQPGDAFYIINDGANAFTLNHQDVAAAAADRIISPTGVNLLLGPDEMAKLWYDPVATRWRILETTGA